MGFGHFFVVHNGGGVAKCNTQHLPCILCSLGQIDLNALNGVNSSKGFMISNKENGTCLE
jgi:hypothetical protein